MIHACGIAVEATWSKTAGRVDDRRWASGTLRHRRADGTRTVDEEILESALKFRNRAWEGCLLSVFGSGRSLESWSCRFDECFGDRLVLDNGAGWSDLLLFVFDGSWLRCNRFLVVLDSYLKTKLELRLCSSVELLVDGSIVWVENDERSGTVGIALKDSLCRGRNRE